MATIKEAEAHHVTIIKEVEDHHTAQVHILQKSHKEDIQKFEHEALEKEQHTPLLFLEACGAALRVSLVEAHGVLLYSLQFLMGNIQPASLPAAALQLVPPVREPPLTVPLPQSLNHHLLLWELNGSTTHLERRLLDPLLLPKSLLIRSGKKESSP